MTSNHDTLIKLKVHADSRQDRIIKKADDAYEVWVRRPAQHGLANNAALGLLAGDLGLDSVKLQIIRGSKTPNKIVKVYREAKK